MIPEPGRYEDIPEETYHREWEALNASTLGYLKRSPLYCKWRMENPDVGTPATDFGSAVHCAVLEPEAFGERYMLEPQCPPEYKPRGWHNRTEYKEAKADLHERGFKLLSQKELDGCRTITDRIYDTPGEIRELLAAKSGTEVSYVASNDGLRCKVRPDIEVRDCQMVVDLKTARCAMPGPFERAIYQYGYHRTKPFYLETMNLAENTMMWKYYLFLVVENTPPYEVALYDLDPAATDLGRREMVELKILYNKCMDSGEWPGYPTHIQTIGVPNWAYYEETDDE
jgi:hypothetical protein